MAPLRLLHGRFGKLPGIDRRLALIPDDARHVGVRADAAGLGLDIETYDPSSFRRKALRLQRERYALPSENGSETLAGVLLSRLIERHRFDHLVVIPVENLLVEPATVAEALRLHLEERFDVTFPADVHCGGSFAIYHRDLLLGLATSHPDVMDLRGGLAWACLRPLYLFRIGSAPNPIRMPMVAADLRLVGARQERALATLGDDDLASPGFAYPAGDRLQRLLEAYYDAGPRVVGVEATGLCQGRCAPCPRTVLGLARPAMAPDVAARLATGLDSLDDWRLVVAGMGEPLAHPDLGAILAPFAGRHQHVITNGQDAPTDPVPAWLRDLDLLTVSVDAVDAEMYATTRAGLSWQRLQEAMGRLILLKETLGDSFPEIGVRFLKHQANDEQTFAFLNYWKQVSLNVTQNLFMDPIPSPKIPPKVQWHQIIGPATHLGQVPAISRMALTPLNRRPCQSALQRLQVWSDGTIVCCQFDAAGQHRRGRVGETDVLGWWRSEEQRAWRRLHLQRAFAQLAAPCRDCTDWYHLWD